MNHPVASPVQVTPAPAVSRVGRFYVTRELGRGTVAAVYLGHDPVIDRPVALKTFSPKLTVAERKQHEQHFINEARAAGRLTHPGIVTIYDASNEGGTAYIAMEYLQGKPLNHLLDDGHRFSFDEVAGIVWKVADALDHAHKHDVVHRDIKPANIFIVRDRQPKIVDFGIARAPNRVADQLANTDSQYTMFHDNLLGTPNYMSPEQAMGRTADGRSDIYSLGAVMYEMLTGQKPFHSENTERLLEIIAHKAPPSPHEVDRSVPLALSHVVMKAMSKRPEKRYQAASEMVFELKRYLTRERRSRARLRRSGRPESAPRNPQDEQERFLRIGAAIGAGMLLFLYLIWRHLSQ